MEVISQRGKGKLTFRLAKSNIRVRTFFCTFPFSLVCTTISAPNPFFAQVDVSARNVPCLQFFGNASICLINVNDSELNLISIKLSLPNLLVTTKS